MLDVNLAVGDLYLRMIQCLYRKFTIRKGAQYEKGQFIQIMRSVGKLALQTLIANNPLVQKNEVLRIVGDAAFEYGFFSGHEDFRPCTNPTADIYVTYGHRSIEEFFGSFGFIQALDNGQSIDDILGYDCEKPIFMVNPLVLKFCLWFLSAKYFEFWKQTYDELVSYVSKCIDCHRLDTMIVGGLFRAIDIGISLMHRNNLLLNFYKDVFDKCVGIGIIYLRMYYQKIFSNYLTTILGLLNPKILNKVTVFSINETLTADVNIDRSKFNILIRTKGMEDDSLQILNLLLTKYIF